MRVHQVYRWLSALALLNTAQVFASSDPFIDVLQPGGAAVGYVLRWQHSIYRGAEGGADQTALYLYEGEYGYLHATRIGLKQQPSRLRKRPSQGRRRHRPTPGCPACAGMTVGERTS